MVENKGIFIISLDFELFWGVRDLLSRDDYGANILGARTAIPLILSLFEKYNIHATVAVVGLLFCKSKEEIIKYSPDLKPNYKDKKLSPYEKNYIDQLDEIADPYHSASELLLTLKNSPNIEIASHTFCHYYCNEDGQSIDEFEADINTAVKIARDNGLILKSIVFPRNQIVNEYLKVCSKYGMTQYRGNPTKLYDGSAGKKARIMRVLDSYINICGDTTFDFNQIKEDHLFNIRASRFLRPYSKAFAALEGLKCKRIKSEMTSAAKHHKIYHLWWHPHNFGKNQTENLNMLEDILKHHNKLLEKYGFESHSMGELTNLLIKKLQ
jgi:peptidoglycan/xylan/chitin deacetylase (PgdA/CDA1 family)